MCGAKPRRSWSGLRGWLFVHMDARRSVTSGHRCCIPHAPPGCHPNHRPYIMAMACLDATSPPNRSPWLRCLSCTCSSRRTTPPEGLGGGHQGGNDSACLAKRGREGLNWAKPGGSNVSRRGVAIPSGAFDNPGNCLRCCEKRWRIWRTKTKQTACRTSPLVSVRARPILLTFLVNLRARLESPCTSIWYCPHHVFVNIC